MSGGNSLRRLAWAVSPALAWFIGTPAALGEGTPSVVRVEEDWVLVLNVPDDTVNCPQFHTTMSPTSDLDMRYFQVNWNYRENPDFAMGGLELLNWSGDSLLKTTTMKTEQLSTSAETITWTQALFTSSEYNILGFQIINGNSSTWGSFSTLSWGSTPGLDDLNGYSPELSAANSWITYGSNRVDLLAIVEVRFYDADHDLIATDQTPHVVYIDPEESGE